MEQQQSNNPSPPANAQPPKKGGLGKVAVTLGAAAFTGIGAVFGGFIVHRSHVVSTFETSLEQVISDQTLWLNDVTAIISAAGAPSPVYPSNEAVTALRTHVLATVVELSNFRAPDQSLEKVADDYKKSLELLAGALNQYDGSHPAFVRVASAAQNASNVGFAFHAEVNGYSADFVRKSIKSLFWS